MRAWTVSVLYEELAAVAEYRALLRPSHETGELRLGEDIRR